ncbi:MAG TPA: FtsX-like permease family protein [Acidimicrobiia bacterium]|jgi:putative ABC transport system permease protein|nr:FtsX-like permease family protein [Acidimicrobiia bacterium]
MWKVTVKGILSKKVRFLLTGIAVMLGVAFISGTFVLTATISNTFDGLFSDIYQHTDAVVRAKETFSGNFGSGRGTISADLIPTVRKAPGVALADGTVQGLAIIVDKKGDALGSNGQGAPTFGFAYIPDRQLSTIHVVEGRGPRTPNEVVIDKKSADDAGYKLGDTVPVVTKAGRNDYTLTGIVKFGTADSPLGATIAAFTPPTASRLLGTPGQVDSIDVKADPGVTQDEVVANIRTALKGAPETANVEVISGTDITKESQNDLKDNLSFFNTFLLIFGVVALLVGSFIIFNTFSIIVAQRSRELALLRAIGAGQRQVLGSVLFEAVLVGLTASVVGFVAGIFLAGGLKALLGALGLDIPASSIVIPASAVIWSFVTGLVVTVIAAVAPALRASRIPPIAAMRDSSVDRSSTSPRRAVIGGVVSVLGLALLLLGLFGNSGLIYVGVGMAVVFLGVAILGPMIASPLSGALGIPIEKIKGITGSIARENAQRNPKRTSATAAALMIGVALVGLITVFGASARKSVDVALDRSMKADYVITSPGFGQGSIPLEAQRQLAALPNVQLASGIRSGQAKIEGSVEQVIAADPTKIDSLFDLQPTHGKISQLTPNGIAVLDTVASDNNWKVGQHVPLEFAQTGKQEFTVETIYKQTGFTNYVITTDAYERNFRDQFDFQVYVNAKGGVTPANTAAIKKVMHQFPGPKVQTRDEYKASQAAQINQFLNLVYVLLFFAIVIALFGIANTLGLSIIERRHELGLLRAVGMTRRQLRSSVRWESVIIALLGTLLGLVIGVVFAWAMVKALHDQGIEQFSLAAPQLLVIVILAAVFGVIAAAWPARRAAKLDVLRSIES